MQDVGVRPAAGKGLGVFARRRFPSGAVILRYGGRPVSKADLPTLTNWEREHLGEVAVGVWQVLPEPVCYLNHACSPNAVSTSNAVYALREIARVHHPAADFITGLQRRPESRAADD